MPSSSVVLDFTSDGVVAHLKLPLDRLQIAYRKSITAVHGSVDDPAAINDYLVLHILPVSPDGARWSVRTGPIRVREEAGIGYLETDLLLGTPAGENPRKFTLYYDAIAHEILTHTAVVAVGSDWKGGRAGVGDAPEVIGVIRYLTRSVEVDRGSPGVWRGYRALFILGLHHIAEGTDHLLFLFALLLPAPLLASGGRWAGLSRPPDCLKRIAKTVTAFTVGHSLTLALSVCGFVHPPEAVVETLVALSVVFAALHAARPVGGCDETRIAGTFGLVHGLAFASALSRFHLRPAELAGSLLAFNLGVEAMQLLLVAAILPCLVLLSRTSAYPALRWTGAAVAGISAVGWAVERIWPVHTGLATAVETAGAHPLGCLLLLVTLTACLVGAERLQGTPSPETLP